MEIPRNLLPTRIQSTQYERTEWLHEPQPGVTLDQVMDPNYWSHLAGRLKVRDRIEVLAADRSYDVDLRVIAIDPRGHWVQVALRGISEDVPRVVAAPGPSADPQGYVIDNDPVQGWRILQGRDLIAKGFGTEELAKEALANLKAAGRPKRAA